MWKIVLSWNLAAVVLALVLPWDAKYLVALACFFAMIGHLIIVHTHRNVR
jgi:hypothetical protein